MNDVSRDWVDWVTFWIGIGGIVVGATAILIAVYTYQHAKGVEQRTRKMVAAERRRVFELEVLRDMLGIIDRSFAFLNRELKVGEVMDIMENDFGWAIDPPTSLSLFPEELPFWNFIREAPMNQASILARLNTEGVPTADRVPAMDTGGLPGMSSRDVEVLRTGVRIFWQMRWALFRDVTEAIERRAEAEL